MFDCDYEVYILSRAICLKRSGFALDSGTLCTLGSLRAVTVPKPNERDVSEGSGRALIGDLELLDAISPCTR